ncbi:hypothetical protein EAO77_34735 [Streptomyces sp. t39]|nr:hypothetical protein EAO77_34735 [Streptomyces sp. t39]
MLGVYAARTREGADQLAAVLDDIAANGLPARGLVRPIMVPVTESWRVCGSAPVEGMVDTRGRVPGWRYGLAV